MAEPFRAAQKRQQAALKLGMYGLAGSGKTFTALLLAEGLAQISGKRIALVDTERGSDFYAQEVKERKAHPDAFDFDVLHTRSLTAIPGAVRELKSAEHSVIIVDSVTHIWEAAQEAYSGIRTRAGTIPLHAWGGIKRPYKELITTLLNSSFHVIICGREGAQFEEDPESGELKAVGTKMKAEGETPYEPNILLHMQSLRAKDQTGIINAFAVKDRIGVLAQKFIPWPNFENIVKPLLPYLGETQGQIQGKCRNA